MSTKEIFKEDLKTLAPWRENSNYGLLCLAIAIIEAAEMLTKEKEPPDYAAVVRTIKGDA